MFFQKEKKKRDLENALFLPTVPIGPNEAPLHIPLL
jgi:hypothetical protein